MTRTANLTLCLAIVLSLVATTMSAHAAPGQVKGDESPSLESVPGGTTGGPDAYGYTFYDEADYFCDPGFFDISTTGTPVTFTATGGFPADDDGGAVIVLDEPFEFYGLSFSGYASSDAIVMSANGYLAFGGDLTVDRGGDFSNDCPLPTPPDNQPANPLRIMPFHDDLSGNGVGRAYTEYFPSCPRMDGYTYDEGSCTIFQWTDWGFFASTDVFTFQTILYHRTFKIAFEIQPGDSGAGTSATVGIQNETGTDGLAFSCNAPSVTAPKSICFFDPRYPPIVTSSQASIPTVSTWGLIILSMLLAVGAVILLRRRRERSVA